MEDEEIGLLLSLEENVLKMQCNVYGIRDIESIEKEIIASLQSSLIESKKELREITIRLDKLQNDRISRYYWGYFICILSEIFAFFVLAYIGTFTSISN